jgi:chemotaxis regulatin CheY-phosphate phosphatase CheZ
LPVVEQAEGEEEEDMRVGDERLLNGPQMADAAISQDEIDKLLADFD